MKYPNILLFRNKEYEIIDTYFTKNHKNELFCNVNITSDVNDLNKLFNPNYPLLITYGDLSKYMFITNVIPERFCKRWIHYDENKIPNINTFNHSVNYCFMHNVKNIANNQIQFSLFTTCYKSFDKIKRAYNSIKAQTFIDWEWVILDDTPCETEQDRTHFDFLKSLFENDHRIRLYKRSENDGNIGNVKNEAVLLCRGKYVLEMDHDDELLPYTLQYAYEAFETDKNIGFVYMNYANIYENGNNFKYSNHFSLGYAGYYCQKYRNKWLYVASSPNINDITLSNIVAIPNHPRIWRKDFLTSIGNYSELLPISDDYELFIRTALSGTKIVKINELGYIQYMNDGNNNFSLIRNSEINRLCIEHIYPQYKEDITNSNSINTIKDGNIQRMPIWKLGPTYEPKYGNIIYSNTGKKQIVFIGFETFLYKIENGFAIDPNIEYIVLDNIVSNDAIIKVLDFYNLCNFKCYSMTDCTEEELVNYFKLILQNGSGNYEFIYRDTYHIKTNI